MKTKILILALAAFCSFSSISAGNCIDNLFNTASNAEKVNLNSFVLGLLKPFSSELKGIKSMSIIDAENISSKDYTRFEKIITQCYSDGYETVTSSNEENEIVRILMKIEKEKIREIVIISLEENEISLIRIKGKIDPNQMQNIIEDNA
jgi:hypothetical protein